MPPAMRTMLESYDWSGKTIYPFITNAGWPGEALKEIALSCRGAEVKPGLDVRFDAKRKHDGSQSLGYLGARLYRQLLFLKGICQIFVQPSDRLLHF